MIYAPSSTHIFLLQFVFFWYHVPTLCAQHTVESRRQFNKCGEISIVLCCRSLINCRPESIISWLTEKTSEARCAAIPYKRRHANAEVEWRGSGRRKRRREERGRGGRREEGGGSLEMKKTLVSREHNVCRLSDFAFATHAFNAESPRASIVRATLE